MTTMIELMAQEMGAAMTATAGGGRVYRSYGETTTLVVDADGGVSLSVSDEVREESRAEQVAHVIDGVPQVGVLPLLDGKVRVCFGVLTLAEEVIVWHGTFASWAAALEALQAKFTDITVTSVDDPLYGVAPLHVFGVPVYWNGVDPASSQITLSLASCLLNFYHRERWMNGHDRMTWGKGEILYTGRGRMTIKFVNWRWGAATLTEGDTTREVEIETWEDVVELAAWARRMQ